MYCTRPPLRESFSLLPLISGIVRIHLVRMVVSILLRVAAPVMPIISLVTFVVGVALICVVVGLAPACIMRRCAAAPAAAPAAAALFALHSRLSIPHNATC